MFEPFWFDLLVISGPWWDVKTLERIHFRRSLFLIYACFIGFSGKNMLYLKKSNERTSTCGLPVNRPDDPWLISTFLAQTNASLASNSLIGKTRFRIFCQNMKVCWQSNIRSVLVHSILLGILCFYRKHSNIGIVEEERPKGLNFVQLFHIPSTSIDEHKMRTTWPDHLSRFPR